MNRYHPASLNSDSNSTIFCIDPKLTVNYFEYIYLSRHASIMRKLLLGKAIYVGTYFLIQNVDK